MKKTLIATAVSVALGVPVAAQSDVTVYGFVHNMIEVKSEDGKDSTTDMSTRGSRFGFKASSDLGNGLTAALHQEFGVATDKNASGFNTRIGKVGVSGGFGSINVGRQWSTLYNTVGVYMDPTSTVAIGGYGGHYITNNTIQYANSFGPVSLSLDARVDDSKDKGGAEKPAGSTPTIPDGVSDEGGDGYAVGVSVAATPNITLAAATDNTSGFGRAGNITKTGLAARVDIGNYYASYAMHDKQRDAAGGYKAIDTDYSVFLVGGSFGNTNAFIGLGNTDDNTKSGSGKESDTVTVHVDHTLMGGLKLLYEGRSTDGNMDGDEGDKSRHVLGLKLAF